MGTGWELGALGATVLVAGTVLAVIAGTYNENSALVAGILFALLGGALLFRWIAA